ncbi:MAG: hypothetical protein U1D30_09735 [Planctomycetota bacterium]
MDSWRSCRSPSKEWNARREERDRLLPARLVIEKASGMSYEAFVVKGQIEPLGLTHTIFPSRIASVQQETIAPGQKHQRFLADRACSSIPRK